MTVAHGMRLQAHPAPGLAERYSASPPHPSSLERTRRIARLAPAHGLEVSNVAVATLPRRGKRRALFIRPRACRVVVSGRRAGVASRRARFTDFLEPGYAQSPSPPPEVVSEAISGGVYELIRAYAVEGRLHELPESLPEATVIALSPFVGSAEAERLAARPAPVLAGRG